MKPGIDKLAKIMLLEENNCKNCIFGNKQNYGDNWRCTHPSKNNNYGDLKPTHYCKKFEWDGFHEAGNLLQDS